MHDPLNDHTLDELRQRCRPVAEALRSGDPVANEVVRSLVREVLGILAVREPGHAAELRVAPYAAVQLLAGQVHRRGTPPTVVALTPASLLALFSGALTLTEVLQDPRSMASGSRADEVLSVVAGRA